MNIKNTTFIRCGLAIVLFVSFNIFSNNTFTSWKVDVTDNKLFTLSQGTKNIVDSLEEPVSLRFYFSQTLLNDNPHLKSYGTRVRELLETYEEAGKGKIELSIIEPEQFSVLEDEAVSYGMRQVSVGNRGEFAYLGLAGSNTTDDEMKIAFFHPEKEQSLEYELTNMVYQLGNPQERVVGVISSLPVFGKAATNKQEQTASWRIIERLRGEYQLLDLGEQATYIAASVDTLLVIHPKSLSDKTLYAIDQFVLRGGNAIIFVDPIADADETKVDPANPMVPPIRYSSMPKLFDQWGVTFDVTKVAGDLAAAMKVQASQQSGTKEITYIPWLQLLPEHFNNVDFSTSQLSKINVGTAGFLTIAAGAKTTLTPLISTSEAAMAYERDAVLFVRDPTMLVKQFESGEKPLVIAARVAGKVTTAFPNGKPASDVGDPAFISESDGSIKVIIVADTDILSDRFWVQFQNMRGVRVAAAHADNAKFLLNSIDMLGGNGDMVSLRSRGEYKRPFDRVDNIRSEAEAQFREREQALLVKLKDTEQKLQALKSQNTNDSGSLLSPEQRKEIESFQQEKFKIRNDLRAVQHDLNKNIDQLGTQLKFLNIGFIPILIGLLAIVLMAICRKRNVV